MKFESELYQQIGLIVPYLAHRVWEGEPRHGDGDEHLEREDAPQDGQTLRRHHHHQYQRQEPR